VWQGREKDDVVTHRDCRIAQNNERHWNARRIEVSFDSGNDDEGAPKNGRQRLNDFLALFTLGGRADLEPTLNKTGIMFQEIERDDSRQHREEKPKTHASQKWRVQAGAKSITAMMI
jgi:hypothetical protein